MLKKYVTGISAAALVALTAGCGGGNDAGAETNPGTTATSTASATSTEHNDADVTFAQMMIPHHQQAVAMADIAATKATNPTVKTLAGKIKDAQAPEIQQMTALLETWGESTDTSGTDHDAGHGMMTDHEMTHLEESTGAEFDTMWLQMMIEHHEGAVTMAKTQLEQGENPDTKALAQAIIDVQEAEITEMRGMA